MRTFAFAGLEDAQVRAIFGALGARPYGEVAALIQALFRQYEDQLKAAAAAEEATCPPKATDGKNTN